jgi:lipopolysaccharide export LptBFGC system permease protein LptF
VQSQIQEAMTAGDTATAQKLQQTLGAMYKQNTNDKVVSILSKTAPITDEDKRFLKGVQGMTQMTKTDPAIQAGVARANAFAGARRLPVVGDNGEVTYMRADEADRRGMQTPQSVSFQSMKDADIYFKSGKGGQMLTNIKTADRHIAQLRRIAQALNNKDTRLVNALGNQYAIETGSNTAPLDFQGVSAAVNAELAKTATGGVGTKAEADALGQAYSKANSPQAIDSVLGNYHELMQSKQAELMKQWKGAGQATNFKEPGATAPATPAAHPPKKVRKPTADPLGLF